MFPISITKRSGRAESRSGGKDYHVIYLVTNDGRSMLIRRWGKKGQWGIGWKVEKYRDEKEGRRAFDWVDHNKFRREYDDIFISKSEVAKDPDDLLRILGTQYWVKLGADRLGWLSPDIDTSDLPRGVPDSEFAQDDRGNWRRVEQPRRQYDAVPVAAEPTTEELIKQNPNWGTWG